MELFKNGVGRPSNETKKKRRSFVIAVILVCVIAIGGLSYLVINNFSNEENNSDKLKGDASYDSIPASKNIKYMKVEGGLIGWTLSGNKLEVGFYPYGDVDLDGAVSSKDAYSIMKVGAKLVASPSTKFKKELLDVNRDGKIKDDDARTAARTAAKAREYYYSYCVSTKKEVCNWEKEDDNSKKVYYLEKGKKYYINAKHHPIEERKYFIATSTNTVYSSDVITTNSSKKRESNKWIYSNSRNVYINSNYEDVTFYSNDGFSKIKYDTSILRVRRLDDNGNKGPAKYRIYKKGRISDYGMSNVSSSVSIITKNGAADTISVLTNNPIDENHDTKYWIEKKANGLPIYIDKACDDNSKSKEKYQTFIKEINKLSEYVAGSVNYVEILNNKNFASHSYSGESNAGEYDMGIRKIMLNCDTGATKHTVFHEFGHAIDNFYKDATGKYLHELKNFKKDYNTSLKYEDKILTWNNGYAYKNRKEFFAQAFASYMLVKEDNYKHADLSKIGQTIYIKKVVDLNWRIKTESMSAYNKLYKTIFVD